MKYTLQKVFLVAFCSIFIVIGMVFIVGSLKVGGKAVAGVAFGGFFVFVGSLVLIGRYRQLTRFQTMTYEWYRRTHPDHVQGHRVSCFSCGSPRIQMRALMNRTFHREHVCTQCGKALYYSPE